MKLEIQVVPAIDGRPETGPMQFGDDWPGVFIRGDNAAGYALALEQIIEIAKKHDTGWGICIAKVEGLKKLLISSRL